MHNPPVACPIGRLIIRVNNRQFTRFTAAFSKKLENHKHAAAIYFHALQFLPDSYHFARDTSHGSGDCKSCLDAGGNCWAYRLTEVDN